MDVRLKNTTFSNNNIYSDAEVSAYGGAVFIKNTYLLLEDGVNFFDNSAINLDGKVVYGGALAAMNSTGNLENIVFNEDITFANNEVSYHGGAIYSNNVPILMQSGEILISGNKMIGTSGYGGAITLRQIFYFPL